jgi:hypothetical protein
MATESTPVKRRIGGRVFTHSFNWLSRITILAGLFAVIYFAYRYSLRNIIHGSIVPGVILFWVVTAYITLPRIHRWLTKLYLPTYYIGRTRTGDGLLGDQINIAINGSAKDLRTAMHAAGWAEADSKTVRNSLRMIKASLLSKSYPGAPGNAQYLFGYKQVYSFQKEDRTPLSRHHVRFWKTPAKWWLPGGYKADWLGAVHYDKSLGIGLLNGQITHKTTETIDTARDFLLADLRTAGVIDKVHTVKHFSGELHGRVRTDGAMPFVNLRAAGGKPGRTTKPKRAQHA